MAKIPDPKVRAIAAIADRMVRGEFTVRAAAVEMDRRVDGILAKRRWMLDRDVAA